MFNIACIRYLLRRDDKKEKRGDDVHIKIIAPHNIQYPLYKISPSSR